MYVLVRVGGHELLQRGAPLYQLAPVEEPPGLCQAGHDPLQPGRGLRVTGVVTTQTVVLQHDRVPGHSRLLAVPCCRGDGGAQGDERTGPSP